jgi:hypothetical protein
VVCVVKTDGWQITAIALRLYLSVLTKFVVTPKIAKRSFCFSGWLAGLRQGQGLTAIDLTQQS